MNKRFESLDAFRGIAAISVVMYHMRLVGSITELDFFRESAIFVEFFFVLSGFVLTHGYGFKRDLKFFTFMKKRFFRLYPLHFFMFLVFVLIELGKLAAYKQGGLVFNRIPFTEGAAISEVIPNLLLVQSWLPFTNYVSFNYPSWSISIEFYLYALLFLTLLSFDRLKKYIWGSVVIVAFYLMLSESDMLTKPVLRGLTCFFGGSLTYLLYRKISHIKIPKTLGSLMEIALVVFIIMAVQADFKYQNIFLTILFYIVVLFFAFESGIVSRMFKTRPFQESGKLSYSIYLTHVAILFCLTSVMMVLQVATGIEMAPVIDGERHLTSGNNMVNNSIAFLILAFIIFISQMTYKHVELRWYKK